MLALRKCKNSGNTINLNMKDYARGYLYLFVIIFNIFYIMLCKLCKCVLVYRSLLPVDNWLEICLKIMSLFYRNTAQFLFDLL